MENQNYKLVENRELTQAETDLIDELKAKGQELLVLHNKVIELIGTQDLVPHKIAVLQANALGGVSFIAPEPEADVLARHKISEPRRWALIGKTELQQGIMALVRAVIQPIEF